MRDELIATVSHELRTPLTSILGYTEILVDMGEPAISGQAARLLEIVRRNAERELKLVEDLLTIALLGNAGLTVEPVPTDLAPVVEAVIEELVADGGRGRHRPHAQRTALVVGRRRRVAPHRRRQQRRHERPEVRAPRGWPGGHRAHDRMAGTA